MLHPGYLHIVTLTSMPCFIKSFILSNDHKLLYSSLVISQSVVFYLKVVLMMNGKGGSRAPQPPPPL